FVLASLVSFSPSAGEAVSWHAEGTSLVIASDVFSTTLPNLFKVSVTWCNIIGRESKVLSCSKLKKLELVRLEALLEVPIECSSVQQLEIALISLDNLVNFEESSFSSVGTNEESRAGDILKKIKLKDLLEFLKDTRSAFFTPDSPQDEPIIVTDESEEEDADKEETHDTSYDMLEDTSVPPPPSPKSTQI
nr:hypothetical protein [Tanacetum cinerariifolium]